MTDSVLCINAGSSSIKFQMFEVSAGGALSFQFKGEIDGIGVQPRLKAENATGDILVDQTYAASDVPDANAAVPKLAAWLRGNSGGAFPTVIGHRLVFGGTRYDAPTRITDEVLAYLERMVPLMPLHLPPELAPIKAIASKLPEIPQVGVFDTSFHRGHAEIMQRFPLPDNFFQEGVLSYGYHGISYEFISRTLPDVAPELAAGHTIVAHLGSGCSMCAIQGGKSVAASWGFSALDGLPMGTRPGRLDPGILLYMLQVKKMSTAEIEHLLYNECGLKALSGISNDVRLLLNSDAPRAHIALDIFALRCAQMVAELATAMGGFDGLVFTAGVGERAAPVRAAIGARLAWLGMEIDAAANERHGPRISTAKSRIACYVVPTNEELMIAHHSLALMHAKATS